MKRCLFSQQWLLLFLLPLPVKTEDEFCDLEEKINVATPFRLLYKGVCSLTKNVYLEMAFEKPNHCAMKCITNLFCAGYNFKRKEGKKPNCQLTYTLDHQSNFCSKDNKVWNLYHPLVPRKIPCNKMKKCKNGGKVIVDFEDGPGSDPYKCNCPKGYEGKLCEIVPFFESVVLSEELQYRELLKLWIGGSFTAKICWRASRDGWAASIFHSNCDNKVLTVTIVKVGNYIFGGYATASWSGSGFKQAPGSFIFSLRNKENLTPFKAPLKNQYTQNAIQVITSQGPIFGNDIFHLHTNAASHSGSHVSLSTGEYQSPSGVSDPNTILAGAKFFSPTEVEIFYLV